MVNSLVLERDDYRQRWTAVKDAAYEKQIGLMNQFQAAQAKFATEKDQLHDKLSAAVDRFATEKDQLQDKLSAAVDRLVTEKDQLHVKLRAIESSVSKTLRYYIGMFFD